MTCEKRIRRNYPFARRLERWHAAGHRLAAVEPEEFDRLLALAEAVISIHERELESKSEFNARLAEITGPSGAAN